MRPPDPLQLLWIADQLEQIRELQEFVNPPSLQGAYARHVSGSVGLTDGSRPDAEVPRITNHLELLEQRISHDFEAARAQQARIHALQARYARVVRAIPRWSPTFSCPPSYSAGSACQRKIYSPR